MQPRDYFDCTKETPDLAGAKITLADNKGTKISFGRTEKVCQLQICNREGLQLTT